MRSVRHGLRGSADHAGRQRASHDRAIVIEPRLDRPVIIAAMELLASIVADVVSDHDPQSHLRAVSFGYRADVRQIAHTGSRWPRRSVKLAVCVARERHKKPKVAFGPCRSPKPYKHLETGRYTFRVRGVNSTGDDRHTANKTVRIN
jgi:hypothetical protein